MPKPERKATDEDRPLTERQEAFCREYLVDRSGTQAAIRAGYSVKTAKVAACNLLKDPRIHARLHARFEKVAEVAERKFEVTAERVIEELAKVGFASMRQFVTIDANGQPQIDLTDAPEWALDALAEVKTETVLEGRPDEEGNRQAVRKTQIKLHDKLKALTHLGEITGAFRGAKEETANAFANAFLQLLNRGSRAPIRAAALPREVSE